MAFPWIDNLTNRFPWLDVARVSVLNLSRALITASLLVTGGVLAMRYLGLLEAAELAAYDQLMQLQPDAGIDDRLLVVGVTENDLQILQEWPLSDRTIAQAIERLAQAEPRAIALDIFRDFPNEPGTSELQAQVQQQPNALMICKTSSPNDLGTPPPPYASPDQVAFADVVVDSGGILRRSLLMAGTYQPEAPFPRQHLCNEPGQVLLSLSFRAALLYLAAEGIEPSFTPDQQLLLGSTLIPQIDPNVGGYQQVDAAGYQLLLYYRSEDRAVPEVSLMEVINGQVDPALIRDRIVFIGYTTPQAKDEFYTPYSSGKDDQQKMPGVVVHAQSTSQLLSTVLDGRPLIWSWPSATEILWIFTWSLVGGLLAWYLRHPARFALVILAGCGTLYGLCFLVFIEGGWIPLVPAAFTFIGTAVGIVSFDRFNNSTYGQEVYRKVKTFLRLEIDIDDEKVEQQVSEITESDYFRDLQQTVQSIRSTPEDTAAAAPDWPHEHLAQPWHHHAEDDEFGQRLSTLLQAVEKPVSPPSSPAETQTEDDYWQSLSADFQAAKTVHTRSDLDEDSPAIAEPTVPPAVAAIAAETDKTDSEPDDYALNFLQTIAQEATLLQRSSAASAPSASASTPLPGAAIAPPQPSGFDSFSFEATYCDYSDSSASTQDYLSHLSQKLQKLRLDLEAKQD